MMPRPADDAATASEPRSGSPSRRGASGPRLRTGLEVAAIATQRFVAHDGWAIASHIALSILTSLFPFLILLTALAGQFGTASLADEAGGLLLDAFPREVATPIAGEVHRVLTQQRGGLLTLGAVLALYFSSSGVESLRVGLNRAYGLRETRAWWVTRIESIGYVVCGALGMLAFSFLIVLGPLIWRTVTGLFPALAPLGLTVAVVRVSVTVALIAAVLVIAHKFVAAGRRSVRATLPGISVTLALWLVGGFGFGTYLDRFAGAYASTYGGLATAMISLVFLYWLAAMFLYGGEVNGTILAARRRRLHALADARRARSPLP